LVLVFPGRSLGEVVNRVGEVMTALRSSRFLKNGPADIQVAASFGLAAYPADAATKKELLLVADRAMYRVKRSTKDAMASGRDS
jgi:diguanylate cyclase (GGDEF)-like protein